LFKILENSQVMEQVADGNYTRWKSVGMEKEVRITETDADLTYYWVIFDINQGQYVDDTENTSPIIVNGVEHTPIDGKIIIVKAAAEPQPTIEEMQVQTLLNTEYLVIISELSNL